EVDYDDEEAPTATTETPVVTTKVDYDGDDEPIAAVKTKKRFRTLRRKPKAEGAEPKQISVIKQNSVIKRIRKYDGTARGARYEVLENMFKGAEPTTDLAKDYIAESIITAGPTLETVRRMAKLNPSSTVRLQKITAKTDKAITKGKDLVNQIFGENYQDGKSEGLKEGFENTPENRDLKKQEKTCKTTAKKLVNEFRSEYRTQLAAFKKMLKLDSVDQVEPVLALMEAMEWVAALESSTQTIGQEGYEVSPNKLFVMEALGVSTAGTAFRTYKDNPQDDTEDPKLFEGYCRNEYELVNDYVVRMTEMLSKRVSGITENDAPEGGRTLEGLISEVKEFIKEKRKANAPVVEVVDSKAMIAASKKAGKALEPLTKAKKEADFPADGVPPYESAKNYRQVIQLLSKVSKDELAPKVTKDYFDGVVAQFNANIKAVNDAIAAAAEANSEESSLEGDGDSSGSDS
ncbi:hypothetical protein ACFL96_05700, partial [Thermoproteota archaeon]